MNLNQNTFQSNATRLNISRSKFHLPFKWTGSFKASDLVPVMSYGDIMPGDTFKVDLSAVIRSTTPVGPTMDDAFIDFYFFFVPHKVALGREMFSSSVASNNYSWEAFIGAQYGTLNVPAPASNTILKMSMATRTSGTYADCIGLPGISGGTYSISCLEPLAYAKVWNDFFRDPNTQNPIYASASYGQANVYNWAASATSSVGTLPLLKACRNHGYFGSCLPWPQRNTTAVVLPIGDKAPVKTNSTDTWTVSSGASPMLLKTTTGSSANGYLYGDALGRASTATASTPTINGTFLPSNLYADLAAASPSSINEVRLAFQTQKFFEELARSGSRYDEIKAGFFCSTDSTRGDRVEYLGGKRIPLNINQVNNTGSSVGDTGAFSLTSDSDHYFTKSFDDWGTLLCLACVRCRDSFFQGLNRRYQRFDRMDYFFPTFSNVGEQPVLCKELVITGNSTADEAVFGYQEAWAEYRYLNDIVCGQALPTNASYGYWTYCHNFTNGSGSPAAPTLSSYIQGTYVNEVDQTLKVNAATAGFQFLAQVYFDIEAVRPMPTHSIPGLIDHN